MPTTSSLYVLTIAESTFLHNFPFRLFKCFCPFRSHMFDQAAAARVCVYIFANLLKTAFVAELFPLGRVLALSSIKCAENSGFSWSLFSSRARLWILFLGLVEHFSLLLLFFSDEFPTLFVVWSDFKERCCMRSWSYHSTDSSCANAINLH